MPISERDAGELVMLPTGEILGRNHLRLAYKRLRALQDAPPTQVAGAPAPKAPGSKREVHGFGWPEALRELHRLSTDAEALCDPLLYEWLVQYAVVGRDGNPSVGVGQVVRAWAGGPARYDLPLRSPSPPATDLGDA